MKTIFSLIFLVSLAAPAHAAQDTTSLYGVTQSTTADRALLSIVGSVEVSTSSKTKSDPSIILNGRQRRLTVSDANRTNVTTMTPTGFYGPGVGLTAIPSTQLSGTVPTGLINSSTITTRFETLETSTGIIQADLATEVSDRGIADAAIGLSTAATYTALNSTAAALTAEIAARIAADSAIGITTDTIKAQVDAIAVDTGTNTTAIANLGASTGTIKATQDLVILSTGALDLAKVNRTGAETMGGTLTVTSSITTGGDFQTPNGGAVVSRTAGGDYSQLIGSTAQDYVLVGSGIYWNGVKLYPGTNSYTLFTGGGGLVVPSSITAGAGFYGDGSNLTGLPPGSDSLGSHIASQTVNMQGFGFTNLGEITSTTTITVSSFTVSNLLMTGPINTAFQINSSSSISANAAVIGGNTLSGDFVSTGTITGTRFYGSGQYLTGIPASEGGAILASTQTFTGGNTFNAAVTISSTSNFSNSTTTTTFLGWVDIGSTLSRVNLDESHSEGRAACPSGTRGSSGFCSCNGGGSVRQNYPSTETDSSQTALGTIPSTWPFYSWSCSCTTNGTLIGIYCSRIK